MKVLFIDKTHPALANRLKKLGVECVFDYSSSHKEILNIISEYDGIIIRSRISIDKPILAAGKKLKFIGRSGAGTENIDCIEADQRGIKLLCAPEGNCQSVGEHALGMILSLFNKISIGDSQIRSGKWNREANRGIELAGKTVGIIGYGNMGQAFASCLSGFNCKILAYDKFKINISDNFVQESSLDNLQKKADIITFHTPYDKSTQHYLDDGFTNKMSKPFYLINTSRGKVVKTNSLVKGLKSNKILGACLDVLEYEQSSFENIFDKKMPSDFEYLISSQKVLLSPHVAGWTVESYKKLALILAGKIEILLGGEGKG